MTGADSLLCETKKQMKKFWIDFRKAVPTILFFLVSFYGVIFFFGTQYLLLVSVVTTTFKLNFQKHFCWRVMLSLGAEQIAVCILAFAASRNLVLCLLMNGIVPFLLVFLRTTRFNQRGYFVNAMVFVFLQLRPIKASQFLPQIGVYMCLLALFIVSAGVRSFFYEKRNEYAEVRRGLGTISEWFSAISKGKQLKETSVEMSVVQSRFYAGTGMNRGTAKGTVSAPYLFMLLFQRTAYFVLDYLQNHHDISEADREVFEKMAGYLNRVKEGLNSSDNETMIQEAGELLGEIDDVSERFTVYLRNFLHQLAMALQLVTIESEKKVYRGIKWSRYIREKKARMHPEQFEMRFAFRLSLVLMVSFGVSRCLNITHSYWLPLNAFLLVQPMYEDSTRRLKNRIIGTLAGSAVIFLILQHMTSTTGHFLLAAVMISFMYSFVPGSIPQVTFSTGFALTLTSLSLDNTTAIELRIIYVLAAVVLVLAANKFCFPTSMYGQFKFNIREMIHMQKDYLEFLTISCQRQIDYVLMGDALAQFNLTYGQAMEYIMKNKNEESEEYRELLNVLWRMVAEIEQMIFYVTAEHVEKGELEEIEQFSADMQRELRKAGGLAAEETDVRKESCEEKIVIERLMWKYKTNMRQLEKICEKNPSLRKHFQRSLSK